MIPPRGIFYGGIKYPTGHGLLQIKGSAQYGLHVLILRLKMKPLAQPLPKAQQFLIGPVSISQLTEEIIRQWLQENRPELLEEES